MRLDIRFPGLHSSSALRAHVRRLMQKHFRKFQHELTTVIVRLVDINGPRRGADKRCQVHVRGPRIGARTLEFTSRDAYDAVTGAARLMERAVARRVGRARAAWAHAPMAPLRGDQVPRG